MEKKKVRTRFAPSPTGFMHVGNLRSALYTYYFARQNNGTFILRIEDTDVERYVEGAVETILKTLELAGIDYDEGPGKEGEVGPYYQSERKPLYKKYAEELVAKGQAYYCFCSKDRLESLKDEHGNVRYDRHCLHLSKEEIAEKLANNEPYVIRQKMPDEGTVQFNDLIYGLIEVDAKELEDQVLLKSDFFPTYNFANVVDDHLMGITHVMRGNEYLSSTPKYNLLYQAFGWDVPEYIHLPPIMRDETHKLSKRYGDANFEDFTKKGYLPHAIVNYISLLGWAPKDNQEKFTMQELIERFSIDGLKKSGSIFDIKKLQWFNFEYLKELSDEEYYNYLLPFLKEINPDASAQWYQNMCVLLRDRLTYGAEAKTLYENFFKEIDLNALSDEVVAFLKEEGVEKTIETLYQRFQTLTEWNEETLIQAIKQVGKELGVKGKMLYMPCRVATTGEMHGPDLGKLLQLLNKEVVIGRMEKLLHMMKVW